MEFPKNSLSKKQLNDIPTPNLEEDNYSEFATNSLIMVESYLQGKNLLDELQVSEAKVEVDENHK